MIQFGSSLNIELNTLKGAWKTNLKVDQKRLGKIEGSAVVIKVLISIIKLKAIYHY